jgi:hypothetical protein
VPVYLRHLSYPSPQTKTSVRDIIRGSLKQFTTQSFIICLNKGGRPERWTWWSRVAWQVFAFKCMIFFRNVKSVVEEFLAHFISAQISCATHFIDLFFLSYHVEQVRFLRRRTRNVRCTVSSKSGSWCCFKLHAKYLNQQEFPSRGCPSAQEIP